MPLTPQDVQDRTFGPQKGLGKRGYDETEVDDFLDEVFAEMTRLVTLNEECGARLAAAQQQLDSAGGPVSMDKAGTQPEPASPEVAAQVQPSADLPSPPPPRTDAPATSSAEQATGILALAQRTADEHLAAARAEAQALLTQAQERAGQVRSEADQHQRETLGALEVDKAHLEGRVEELRAFEREYRSRLRAYLEDQLRDLEGRPDVVESVNAPLEHSPES